MPLPAKTSGCAFASATVSGSSGQPGVRATKPASSKSSTQRSQLDGSNQSPCTKTTGVAVVAFARLTCSSSCSVNGNPEVGVLIVLSSRVPPRKPPPVFHPAARYVRVQRQGPRLSRRPHAAQRPRVLTLNVFLAAPAFTI